MNLARTADNVENMIIDDKKILNFAKKHFRNAKRNDKATWNGRQIRNAFQTAIALAEWEVKGERPANGVFEQARLSVEHFKKVADASADFDEYLLAVNHGKDEDRRALERGDRAPGWNLPASLPKPTESLKPRGNNRHKNEDSKKRKPQREKPKSSDISEDEEDESENFSDD